MGVPAALVRPPDVQMLVTWPQTCWRGDASAAAVFVTERRGDAEGRRARLAERPGLCRKHLPSFRNVKTSSSASSWRTKLRLKQDEDPLIMNFDTLLSFTKHTF